MIIVEIAMETVKTPFRVVINTKLKLPLYGTNPDEFYALNNRYSSSLTSPLTD